MSCFLHQQSLVGTGQGGEGLGERLTLFFARVLLELLEALLYEEGEVDQGAVGGSIYLVVPVKNVRAEVVQRLLDDVLLTFCEKGGGKTNTQTGKQPQKSYEKQKGLRTRTAKEENSGGGGTAKLIKQKNRPENTNKQQKS